MHVREKVIDEKYIFFIKMQVFLEEKWGIERPRKLVRFFVVCLVFFFCKGVLKWA
jgi:hypothetical protein